MPMSHTPYAPLARDMVRGLGDYTQPELMKAQAVVYSDDAVRAFLAECASPKSIQLVGGLAYEVPDEQRTYRLERTGLAFGVFEVSIDEQGTIELPHLEEVIRNSNTALIVPPTSRVTLVVLVNLDAEGAPLPAGQRGWVHRLSGKTDAVEFTDDLGRPYTPIRGTHSVLGSVHINQLSAYSVQGDFGELCNPWAPTPRLP